MAKVSPTEVYETQFKRNKWHLRCDAEEVSAQVNEGSAWVS